MRRSRAEVPLWQLLLIVAVLAIFLGLGTMKHRSKTYRARAAHHAASRALFLREAKRIEAASVPAGADAGSPTEGMADHARAMADYHDRLRSKYEQAGSRPWLAVDPDPPPPESTGTGPP